MMYKVEIKCNELFKMTKFFLTSQTTQKASSVQIELNSRRNEKKLA